MKLLEYVSPPSIYHVCFTQKSFWEEKITPVNMRSCGCRNTRKQNKIKIGQQYIALENSLELCCLEKSKFTSSGPMDYVGISGKGLTTSLTISTRRR